jgi:hypothetical protein
MRAAKRGKRSSGGSAKSRNSKADPQPPPRLSSQALPEEPPDHLAASSPRPNSHGSDAPQDNFPGPLAPPLEAEDVLEDPGLDAIPVMSEARLRLPDAPMAAIEGVTRRRRRRKAATGDDDGSDDAGEEAGMDGASFTAGQVASDGKNRRGPGTSKAEKADPEQVALDAVRQLTEEFRKGNVEATSQLMREIEKDPDYMFQTGNATNEYDMAAALIGTGRPNKQGIYVLPYLQSGHILLLLVVLLCAFVYYPGFPLTELDDEIREWLKRGLSLTYGVNAVLAAFAYRAAKLRSQPPPFWAAKTAFLGGLAFQELRSNVLLDSEKAKQLGQKGRRKRNQKSDAAEK